MYPNREIFPDAPLALVAAEIRFRDSARLRRVETLDAVAIALEDDFPVAFPHEDTDIRIGAPGSQPEVTTRVGRLLKNVAGNASITISSTTLTYETTAYEDFDALKTVIARGIEALLGAGVTPALERVGLRYIDEVRVSKTIDDARDWATWIDARLIDQLNLGPATTPVRSAQGQITYELGHSRWLNFRFAALPGGSVVGGGPLVRKPFTEGPFFVLDFDGFEQFPADGPARLLSPSIVDGILEAVHDPAGETFQNAITDEARRLFRMESN